MLSSGAILHAVVFDNHQVVLASYFDRIVDGWGCAHLVGYEGQQTAVLEGRHLVVHGHCTSVVHDQYEAVFQER